MDVVGVAGEEAGVLFAGMYVPEADGFVVAA